MLKLNLKSIKIKLALIISVYSLIVIGIIIAHTTTVARKQVIESETQKLVDLGRICNQIIEREIDKALCSSSHLSYMFSLRKSSDHTAMFTRSEVIQLLSTILKEKQFFHGIFAAWEPNAFGTDDSEFAGAPGHDATGRFMPYWIREKTGNPRLMSWSGYDAVSDSILNSISKKPVQTVIGPYPCRNHGANHLMICALSPIFIHDTYHGMIGIELDINDFSNLFHHFEWIENPVQIVLISDKGQPAYILGSPSDNQIRRDKAHLEKELEQIRNGADFIEKIEDDFLDVHVPLAVDKISSFWSVSIRIPLEQIYSGATRQMWNRLFIGFGLTIISIMIFIYFVSRLIRPLEKIDKAVQNVSRGELEYMEIESADDEIGRVNRSIRDMIISLREVASVCSAAAIGDFSHSVNLRSDSDVLGKSVNQMAESLRHVVYQAKKIASGNYEVEYCPISKSDELGNALFEMTKALHEMNEENKRQHLLKTGQMELNDTMCGEQDIFQLADNIISYLCKFLKADLGGFYYCSDEQTFKLAGSYAMQKCDLNREYALGEGVIGQAAVNKRPLILSDIPNDRLRVHSGLLEAAPSHIAVIPLLLENSIKGVIELGSFHPFSNTDLAFLDQASERIAIAVNSAYIRDKMATLLEQMRHQAEKLQSQQEELRRSNEELEDQTKALKESEARLQSQQEELRRTNEELAEHTRLLEEQKADIQDKNIELEQARIVIEEKANDLEKINRYKSEFLSNMSHELRTPLNSILLLSKLLIDNKNGNLNEKQLEFCQTIYSSGSDLLSLINNILDLSKVEAGKVEFLIEKVSLSDFVNGLTRKFKPMFDQKGLDFIVRLGDHLPDHIETDRQRAEQVLSNLLYNAYKFTSKGSVTLAVAKPDEPDQDPSGDLSSRQPRIAFSVSDTGIGIPLDKQGLIFEAFQQADGTTSRKYGGTGLGLAISKELAKFLGGELHLNSKENEGSTFTFYLPEKTVAPKSSDDITSNHHILIYHNEDKTDIVSSVPDRDNSSRHVTNGNTTVLIIEPDSGNATVMKTLCQQRGFTPVVAMDGTTGIQLAVNGEPKAIILNSVLPDMNGWEVLERLKGWDSTRNIPVYMVSAPAAKVSAHDSESDSTNESSSPPPSGGGAFPEEIINNVQLFLHDIEHRQPKTSSHHLKSMYEKESVFEHKTILLVDDDMRNVYALSNLLEEKGATVVVGKNGNEALKQIDLHPEIDLVLMDIMMPEMDGYSAMKVIRKKERLKKIPIIALTAKAMKGDKKKCMDAGASDYLAKPVDINKLLSMLRVWLY